MVWYIIPVLKLIKCNEQGDTKENLHKTPPLPDEGSGDSASKTKSTEKQTKSKDSLVAATNMNSANNDMFPRTDILLGTLQMMIEGYPLPTNNYRSMLLIIYKQFQDYL